MAVGNTKDEPGDSEAVVKGGSMTGGRTTYMPWAGLVCMGLLTVGGCTTRPAAPPTMSEETRLCGQGDLTELSTEEVFYLRVHGYTDPTGSRETNEELGTARAHAVAKALQAGLKVSTQVEVVGRGGCCFMPNHADSRRVEITMLLRGRCGDPSSVEERSQIPPVTSVVSTGVTGDSVKP